MKLTTISIRNFRSIKSVEFEFPESGILTLVGPNNAGKSNIIRAIDLVCGEGWKTTDKLEDSDFYGHDRRNEIMIDLHFEDGERVQWGSRMPWPRYSDRFGEDVRSGAKLIKEHFPCTYLGADRTFDKHMSFYDWTLIGKIRRQFHRQATSVQSELKAKYQELVAIFDKVDAFKQFKNDFGRYFDEMQADTAAKLAVAFEPFTPSNYFKSLHITAHDSTQSDDVLDMDDLGEGTRNMVLLALLRSYVAIPRIVNTEIGAS